MLAKGLQALGMRCEKMPRQVLQLPAYLREDQLGGQACLLLLPAGLEHNVLSVGLAT